MRPVAAEEETFWKEVFFDSVREHFSILNLAEYQLAALLESQYQAQKSDYEGNYSKAENDVILYDGSPVGRVILSAEQRLYIFRQNPIRYFSLIPPRRL